MKLILFDFDKTLTFTDTLLPLSYLMCKLLNKRITYLRILITYLLFRLSFKDELSFRKSMCKLLVKEKRVDEINIYIREFYENNLTELFNSYVTEILESENRRGNHCYIVSSNFDFFLNPLLEILNVKGIECTQSEIVEGVYSGFLKGNRCSKQEKWNRVLNLKTNVKYDEVIAYGDSRGDYEMLKNADKGFWVRLKIPRGQVKEKIKKYLSMCYYLIGKIYKPNYETEIVKFTSLEKNEP